MTRKLFILTLMLFAFAAVSYAQTVEDIIKKTMVASGGSDKFDAIKSMKITASMNVMGMTIPMTIINKKPAFRMEQEMMGQKMVTAFNGKTAWMINPMAGSTEPQEVPENMLASIKQQASIGQNPLISMKENGITATYIGKEKVDDIEAYKIKLVAKDGTESFMFINTKTNFAHKMTSSVEMMGQKKNVEMFFKDYKVFSGITMSTVMEINAEGTSMTMKYDNVEINIPIDDSIFEMPKK